MVSDLRILVAAEVRRHPRVAFQGYLAQDGEAPRIAEELPPLTPFRQEYCGAISVVDWDHRLPSLTLPLRIYAYYTPGSLAAGKEAFDRRLAEIVSRDKYPEFDVPDFDQLAADEAYEVEIEPDGKVGRCRLTSAWRREIATKDAIAAEGIAGKSEEFQRLAKAAAANRPVHLGDLEAVSWTPPCESQHDRWTLDVWYLLAFDGRVGTGRSFLVDIDSKQIVAIRDFSVRTG
jgi:hypothetical protein